MRSVLARDELAYVAIPLGIGRGLAGTLAYQLDGNHARLPERSEARLVCVKRHLVPAARALGVDPRGVVEIRKRPTGGVGAPIDVLLVVQLHRVRRGVPVAGILAQALGSLARNYLFAAAQIHAVKHARETGAEIAESVPAGVVCAHGHRVFTLFKEGGYVDFVIRPRLLEAARRPLADVFSVDVQAVILVGGNVHNSLLRNLRKLESLAEERVGIRHVDIVGRKRPNPVSLFENRRDILPDIGRFPYGIGVPYADIVGVVRDGGRRYVRNACKSRRMRPEKRNNCEKIFHACSPL